MYVFYVISRSGNTTFFIITSPVVIDSNKIKNEHYCNGNKNGHLHNKDYWIFFQTRITDDCHVTFIINFKQAIKK